MATSRSIDRIAVYMGISAPETPKYLLTNNFLLDYFEPPQTAEEYSYERFEAMEVLRTEDEANREKLKEAFDRFLNRYLGEETIRSENRRLNTDGRHFYFPLTQDMLTGSYPTLRHILFQLQKLDDEFVFEELQQLLAEYIFHDSTGINRILKILLKDQGEIRKKTEDTTGDGFWSMLSASEKGRMKKLGHSLNEDLMVLLKHPYFTELDFYRRYQYLSVLLTSYVIQYIIVRKGSSSCLLCKGNPQDNRLNGNIHRACCSNYAGIRSLFPELLQKFYSEAVKDMFQGKEQLKLSLNGNEVMVEDRTFEEFSGGLAGRRRRGPMDSAQIMKAFGMEENSGITISVEDFVLRYINLTGSRKGSSLTKISSTLPTCGKQIDMIFPKSNAKQKYFALSGSLTEFYVRLYLAGKGQQYDYLDNFIDHLLNRYHIVIASSRESEKLLKNVKPRLSALELSKNKAAFIDTLNGINCLIKLSDSGYVVTLPEKKGDFTLI